MSDIVHEIINFFFGGEHHHKHHHHHHKHHHANQTDLVISVNYIHLNFKTSKLMSLALNTGEFVTSTLSIIDHTTQQPVTDATFANTVFTVDDPTIASADDQGKITALLAGATNLSVSTDVSYTNSLGVAVTETKKLTIGVVVTAIIVANGVDLVVTFSAPQTTTP